MCDKPQSFQCEDCCAEVEVPRGLFQLVDDFHTVSMDGTCWSISVPYSSTTLKEAVLHARGVSIREWNEDIYNLLDFLQPYDKEVLWRVLPPTTDPSWYFETVGDWGQGSHTIPSLVEEETEEQKHRRLLASLYYHAFGTYRWSLISSDSVLYKFIGAPESITVEELELLSIKALSKTQCERLTSLPLTLDLWTSMKRVVLHHVTGSSWQIAELYIKWAMGENKGSWNYRVLKSKNGSLAFSDLVMCSKKTLIPSQCTMRCIKFLGQIAKSFKNRYGEFDTLWPGCNLTWTWLRAVEKSRLPLAPPMSPSIDLRRSH